MLMKERSSYIDQFDEQSATLTKKSRLIEELRKENEVIATFSYVCMWHGWNLVSITNLDDPQTWIVIKVSPGSNQHLIKAQASNKT